MLEGSRQERSDCGPGDESLAYRAGCQVADQAFQMSRQVLVSPQLADLLGGKVAPALGESSSLGGREGQCVERVGPRPFRLLSSIGVTAGEGRWCTPPPGVVDVNRGCQKPSDP